MKLFAVISLVCGLCAAFAQDDCCDKEAKKTAAQVEGKPACCKSTDEKPLAKGDPGCCNAPGEFAKFKVFVVGKGYKFFGCEGSAKQGREELIAEGLRTGSVQKVTSKIKIS